MSEKDKKSFTIGLQVLDLQLDYSVGIAKGMAEVARKQGVNLAIFPMEQPKAEYGASDSPSVIQELLQNAPVDALVIITGSLVNFLSFRQFYKQLKKLDIIPIVSVGVELEGFPSVINDNREGLYNAVAHLVEFHKLKRIAFVRGPLMHPEAEERYEAYLDCLKDHNIALNMKWVCEGNFTFEAGCRAVKKLCANRKALPEAIVCANDDMAFGVLHELQKLDIHVPSDIAVVGYDNVKEAAYSTPSMSSVDQPVFEIGKLAAGLAIKLSSGEKIKMQHIVPTQFIARNSCGCGTRICDYPRESQLEQRHSGDHAKSDLIRSVAEGICQGPVNDKVRSEIGNLLSIEGFGSGDIDNLVEKLKDVLNSRSVKDDISQLLTDNIREVHTIAQNYITSHLAQALYYALSFVPANYYLSKSVQDSLLVDNRFLHLRNLLSVAAKSSSTVDFFHSMHRVLEAIEIRFFFIVLYEDESNLVGDHISGPINLCKTIFSFSAERNTFSLEPKEHSPKQLFDPRYYQVTCGEAFIVEPLIYLGQRFGHICYAWEEEDRYSRMLFSTLLSAKIRSDNLWREYIGLENQLYHMSGQEESDRNRNSQYTDKLTGLLNHQGFYSSAKKQLDQNKVSHNVLPLVYLRIENYHDIQSEFGEEHANICVSFISDELLSMFDAGSLVSRIKPEMFVVLCPGYTTEEAQSVLNGLSKNINQYNQEADRELELKIESAINQIHPDSQRSLIDYIGDADYLLIRGSNKH